MCVIARDYAALSTVIVRLDRTIQYSRDVRDGIDKPRRTGYPHARGMTAVLGRRYWPSLPATNAKRLRKGALATKQSSFGLAAQWIASLALAMTVSNCSIRCLKRASPHTQPSSSGLTGRSSIPETSVMESISRGVLDPPHARGMTAVLGRRYWPSLPATNAKRLRKGALATKQSGLRHSGFDASHRPGMTASIGLLRWRSQ
jgi:hypothetical protein